jgi:hypothetical protein
MAVIIPKELYEKLVKCLEKIQDNPINIAYNPNGANKAYCSNCWEDFGDEGSGKHKPDCPEELSYEILPKLKECKHVDETD